MYSQPNIWLELNGERVIKSNFHNCSLGNWEGRRCASNRDNIGAKDS